MNIDAVIDDLETQGVAVSDDGEPVEIRRFALTPESGGHLQAVATAVAPDCAVEVGMASGLSTLRLAKGMSVAGTLKPGCLHVMDPKQTTHWKNIGRRSLSRAGMGEELRFYEQPAHEVLPKLSTEGVSIQLAFIDGWHMMDYVMLEAFYCDLMLDENGILALHDLWMPGLQHFASFWCANREYSSVLLRDGRFVTGETAKTPENSLQGSPFFVRELLPYVENDLLLLRKEGSDCRKWDAFTDFIQ